jgi:hypothetical protein
LPVFILLVSGAILAAVTAAVRQNRRNLLARIHAEWGKPRNRVRKMDAIRASHRSRLSASGSSASMDDRTWDDLILDDVFAALDRTESTLGQHALYHRLRTAPIADSLDAFEALVTRMSADVQARERAQMALARLQDAHGYDLWWLLQPDALDSPGWYLIFPLLTASTIVALLVGLDGSDVKPHIVLAATHDGELVDLLRDRYAAFHFGDAIGPNGVTFDYHLLP